MQQARQFLIYGSPLFMLTVLIAYGWIDIPLAQWAHAQDLRQYTWLHAIQVFPEWFPEVAFVVLAFLGIRSVWSSLTRIEMALLYTSLSYVLANFFTKMFKMVFARTWPATWVDNNPSLLNDNVYGFFWFIDDAAYRSFPSGHATAVFAVAVMISCFYPKLRWICGVACACVIVGLIGNYYHFLSDIIAGAYLGTAIALILFLSAQKKL